MNIANIIREKNISKYKLSIESGIPYTTLNDILSGKTRLEKCSGETLYKLSNALGLTMESLVQSGFERSSIEVSYEKGLPDYLQNDLDAYKKGLIEKDSLLDCLWGELYASINIAEINEQAITHEHAQYLRKKYL